VDPVSIIGAALTLGIAAGLRPMAEQAVKDAYQGLKELIERRYEVDLGGLEKKPESDAQLSAVRESLSDAGADTDEELLDQAKALIDLVESRSPETVAESKIDVSNVSAAYLKIKQARAISTGGITRATTDVKIDEGTFEDGVEIGGAMADSRAETDPKARR
jgi:hypothetical protein